MTGVDTHKNSRQLGSPVGNWGELDTFCLIRQTVLREHRKDAPKLILRIPAAAVNQQESASGLHGWRMVWVCVPEWATFIQLSQRLQIGICILNSSGFSDYLTKALKVFSPVKGKKTFKKNSATLRQPDQLPTSTPMARVRHGWT